jgi:hypothetical protein
MNTFVSALESKGFAVLSFKINTPPKGQAGFYVFIASKRPAIYLKAKEFLFPYSECQEDGVPLWGVNLQYVAPSIPGFSKYLTPYCQENLMEELARHKSDFHFKTVQEIYAQHSPGKPYILANYLEALAALQADGYINYMNKQHKQVKTISATTIIFYRLHRVTNPAK